MKKSILITSLILNMLATATVNAQTSVHYGLSWDASTSTEYFVRIDPATSTKTILNSIPGVKLIASGNYTYNSDCDQYVFVGGATAASLAYYVIDAHTGTVISTSPVGDKIDEIAYSHQDRAFYGLWWDASASTEYFVSIDPATSTKTILDSIPEVKWISSFNSAFNPDCNQYVFIGGPTTSSMAYYVIDAHTGAVVSQSPVDGQVDGLAYSHHDRIFYGLWWDASSSTEYFVTVDPATSAKTIVNDIPGVKWINAGNYAYDTDCDRYVFVGGPATSAMAYFVIAASTGGTVISQSPVNGKIDEIAYGGVSMDSPDPEIELNGVISIHSLGSLQSAFAIHLNPSSNGITLEIKNGAHEKFSFILHDMFGRTVAKTDGIHTDQVQIKGTSLTRGVYFFQLRNDKGLVGSGQLRM